MRSFFIECLSSAVLGFVLLTAVPIQANDSEAEIGLGGLKLKQSAHISMDSEDLYISEEQIRVKYKFTNTSNQDISTLVAFPLPPLPFEAGGYWEFRGYPNWETLNFETKVNGKPIKLNHKHRAVSNGTDVTKQLKQLGWPLRWFDEESFLQELQKLPKKKLRQYSAKGLIKSGVEGGSRWVPNWQVITEISRQQIFPAGKSITVEHSYLPISGGSVGGALEKSVRTEYADILPYYRKRYCLDNSFIRGFDRRQASAKSGKALVSTETWIGYILSSGANWKGPIKDFRLVIDKGSKNNLVSFCMDGVKKISPTGFEIRKKNFVPTKELNILIVKWHEIAG